MLMWTLIWCFALQWVLFRNWTCLFFSRKHVLSWLLLNIDTTALPAFNLLAFRQLWVKLVPVRIEPGAETRIGNFRGPWFAVFQHGVDQRSQESFSSYIYIRYMIVFPYPNPVWTLLPSGVLGLSGFFLNWHASISCLDLRRIHKQYPEPLKYLQPYRRYLWVKWCMYEVFVDKGKNHMFENKLGRVFTTSQIWMR